MLALYSYCQFRVCKNYLSVVAITRINSSIMQTVILFLWMVDRYVYTVAKLRIELIVVATQSMLRAIILKS